MYLKYPRKFIRNTKKPVKETKTIEVPVTSKELSLGKDLKLLKQRYKTLYNL